MHTTLQSISKLTALILATAVQCSAIVIAFEDFEDYTGPNTDIVGKNGGTGWAGAWDGDNSAAGIADAPIDLEYQISGGSTISGGAKALRIDANSDTAAFREFQNPQSGDIYVSFLFYAEAGTTLGINDFVSIWLGEGTYIGVPSMGLKSNLGPSGEDLMGRVTGTEEAYTSEMAIQQAYYLVGRLVKDDSVSGSLPDTYSRFDLWVNPSASDMNTPDAVSEGNIDYSEFSRMGVRSVNLGAGDSFLIDSYTFATEWDDVVPVPEMSTYSITIGVVTLAFVSTRRREA